MNFHHTPIGRSQSSSIVFGHHVQKITNVCNKLELHHDLLHQWHLRRSLPRRPPDSVDRHIQTSASLIFLPCDLRARQSLHGHRGRRQVLLLLGCLTTVSRTAVLAVIVCSGSRISETVNEIGWTLS